MPVTRKGAIADEVIGAILKTTSYNQVAVATALGFNVDAKAVEAQIQADGSDIRYTTDGTPPTAAGMGHKLADGDTIFITGQDDMKAFQAITVSAGGKINVTQRG